METYVPGTGVPRTKVCQALQYLLGTHMSVIAPMNLRTLFGHVLELPWKLSRNADGHSSAPACY